MAEVSLRCCQNDGSSEHTVQCPFRSIVLCASKNDAGTDGLERARSSPLVQGPRYLLAKEGEYPRHFYVLLSGWAFQFHFLPDGRRQIFSFLMPGDFIGAEGLVERSATYSVQSLTRVQLCTFDTETLVYDYRENADLRERINTHFYEEISVLCARLIDIGRRTATERIVRLILEIEQRVNARGLLGNQTIPFPLRQTHIADALGLTAVHVNRTINALRRDGLITFRRGAITIEERAAFEQIGGSSG